MPLMKIDKGDVYTFGFGKFGSLGYQCEKCELAPRPVEGISNVSKISAGSWTTVICTDK